MEVFGPVPSRRLGRSLGINLIPPKICSYGCRYCQLGNTFTMTTNRESFYEPEEAVSMIRKKLADVAESKARIDYMAFVPDGEPTLDLHLGDMAEALREFKIPLAIISNASLITDPQVRADLKLFDWVSLKVDSVDEPVWRFVDRPHGTLSLPSILESIKIFAHEYTGHLETETMLMAGVNDHEEHFVNLTSFLSEISPAVCRLSSPIRPPACSGVKCVDEEVFTMAAAIFQDKGLNMKILNAYEGDDFTRSGDGEESLLSILSVHPMTEEAVNLFLKDSSEERSGFNTSLENEDILSKEWQGKTFYVRNLRHDRLPSIGA